MFRILFQVLFFPFRLLVFFLVRLRLLLGRGKTHYQLELPPYFETSTKSFWLRTFQKQEVTPTRLSFLLLLETLSKLPNLKTVEIKVPALEWSLAEFWEVSLLLDKIKTSGKTIRMFAREGGLGTLLLFKKADEVVLLENAEFQLLLPSAEPMFFGGLLQSLGIEVEAYTSGPYKSFGESFTRKEFSREAKKNHEELVNSLQSLLLDQLTDKNQKLIPFFYQPHVKAEDLLKIGLAHSLGSEEDFYSAKKISLGESYPSIYERDKQFKFFGKSKPIIVVLQLYGGISGGDSKQKEIREGKIEVYPFLSLFKEIRENPKIKGIVLEISSPGGSAFYSEMLSQEIVKLKKEKLVVAYCKDTAASGGYYLASAVGHLVASPVCLIGSIGVISIRANLKKLYKKLKLNKEPIGFYPLRDIHSEFVPLSKESKKYLQKQILDMEQLFYRRVSEGRKISIEEMDKLGGGRVYLPSRENRTVDQIGTLLDSFDYLKKELKSEILIWEDLPVYNLRSKIPIIGNLTKAWEFLKATHEPMYLSPIELRWTNRIRT